MNTIRLILKRYAFLLLLPLSGCTLFDMELQKKYDYEHKTLDPNINITARQFLETRSYESATNTKDTVFKWMRKGLDYAGIDLAAYEKQGMTFIFLHNDAVRVYDSKTKKTSAGLWVDFPVATGPVNPATGLPPTKIAEKWEDYPKEDVKNFFLYLMIQGTYNFNNIPLDNIVVQTMLPPGSIASRKSLLGFFNGGTGFDQEGKMALRIVNNDDLAPIMINDKTKNRSGGYIDTYAFVFVYGDTIYPYRLPKPL
jgi:hypothetical protein